MPPRLVQFVQGQYYHLFNRGANRDSIFRGDEDFIAFLTQFKQYTVAFSIQVIAYCLMPNHFHLLVRQDGDTKAGLAVQYTCNSYTQRFNHRYVRQGTLFQGRFRARHVADDVYLRHLCRYIHANPVKDGFALQPELWRYSNYLEWIEQRKGTLVDRAFIKAHFDSAAVYQRFVTDYLTSTTAIPLELRDYLSDLETK